ncbi:DNA methylase [Escherichia coli]|uniref:hypothetical protein n=2 Tax=Enterobacteriaceae TaxID=543 RepID=UPI000DFB1401|nr:hypothetical protein [Escherichia coli]STO98935.1 DNA methylase [Escherichia coli]
MTSLKTSIKTITYLSDIGCLEIQGASLFNNVGIDKNHSRINEYPKVTVVNSKQKCSHSNLEKEYYLGSATGDYKCLDCGEVGFGKDWPEKERSKNDNEE